MIIDTVVSLTLDKWETVSGRFRGYLSTVYSKELIRTGEAGVADLRFHDNSNLSVGAKIERTAR